MKSVALLAGFVLLTMAPVYAANYYASNTGGDNDSGTVTDPFSLYAASVGNAIVTLASGDTVFLEGGYYTEGGNFYMGTTYEVVMLPSTDNVVYKSKHGEWAILTGAKVWGYPHTQIVATNSGADSVVFDSVEFRWGTKCAVVAFGGDRWRFTRCVFDSTPVNFSVSDNEAPFQQTHNTQRFSNAVVESCTFINTYGRGPFHMYAPVGCSVRYNYMAPATAAGPGGVIFLKGSTNIHNFTFHDNEIIANGACVFGVSWHSGEPGSNFRFHHNIVRGTIGDSWMNFTYRYLPPPLPLDMDSVFVYNNTFVLEGSNNKVVQIVRGDGSCDVATTCDVDNFFFFNNIFYRPGATSGEIYKFLNDDNDPSCSNCGINQFGDNFYSDHNLFVTNAADPVLVSRYNSSFVQEFYTLSQWQDTARALNSTWMGDSNSVKTQDSANLFVHRGAGDYRLDPSGSQYSFLATGGRGGSWPTHLGALAPELDTCPAVTLTGPADDTTIANYSVDLLFSVTVDTGSNDCQVLVLGGREAPTPTDTLLLDSVAVDTSYSHTWSGLGEDSTYYWKVVVTDNDCSDASAVRNINVDSIPPPVAAEPTTIHGGTIYNGEIYCAPTDVRKEQ